MDKVGKLIELRQRQIERLDDTYADLRSMANGVQHKVASQDDAWTDSDVAMDTMLYRLERLNRERRARAEDNLRSLRSAYDRWLAAFGAA